jgi:hypothetical protein
MAFKIVGNTHGAKTDQVQHGNKNNQTTTFTFELIILNYRTNNKVINTLIFGLSVYIQQHLHCWMCCGFDPPFSSSCWPIIRGSLVLFLLAPAATNTTRKRRSHESCAPSERKTLSISTKRPGRLPQRVCDSYSLNPRDRLMSRDRPFPSLWSRREN